MQSVKHHRTACRTGKVLCSKVLAGRTEFRFFKNDDCSAYGGFLVSITQCNLRRLCYKQAAIHSTAIESLYHQYSCEPFSPCIQFLISCMKAKQIVNKRDYEIVSSVMPCTRTDHKLPVNNDMKSAVKLKTGY